MNRSFIVLVFLLCGAATAAPRWGDDFDWQGDTLLHHTFSSMQSGISFRDTVLISTRGGLIAFRVAAPDSFEQLFHISIPPYSSGIPLRIGNRIYNGWPNSKFDWNGDNPPIYDGALRSGLVLPTINSISFNSNYLGNNGFGYGPYYAPVIVGDRVLYSQYILSLDTLGILNQVAVDSGVCEWCYLGRYAYGTKFARNQLVVWDLAASPPQRVFQDTCLTSGFPRIFNDTLVTIKANLWQSWSLSNPAQPAAIRIDTLPKTLFWLEQEISDSVYLGWGGWYPGSGAVQTSAFLFRLSPSVTAPIVIDSLPLYTFTEYGLDFSNPGPFQSIRTRYGWIWDNRSGQIIGLQKVVRNDRVVLDTLWFHNQPNSLSVLPSEGLSSSTLQLVEREQNRVILKTIYGLSSSDSGMFIERNPITNRWDFVKIPPRVRAIDGNRLFSCGVPGDSNYIRIGTRNGNSWQFDTLRFQPGRSQRPMPFYFRGSNLICRSNLANRCDLYTIIGDSAIWDTSLVYDNNYAYMYSLKQPIVWRDNSLVFGRLEGNKLDWYRKVDGRWQFVEQLTTPTHAYENAYFDFCTDLDTLALYDHSLFGIRADGTPYFYRTLTPLLEQLGPQQPGGHIYIDINEATMTVGWRSRVFVFEMLPERFEYRGLIIAPTHSLNLFAVENSSGILLSIMSLGSLADCFSKYSIPPYSSIVDESSALPVSFQLGDPFPNPFNQTVILPYTLPMRGIAELCIIDILGREVFNKQIGPYPAGTYLTNWNGKSNKGDFVSSGVYFLKLRSGDFEAVKKVVLLR
ncbi:MAG: T9SS type A sorting domain-containing protein [bacterium]|nr:T9SS type A sorting domain-containing protein [bacterium]